MMLAAHQPHYLPWLGYIDKFRKADVFVLLDTVSYVKGGWQNRNKILTKRGPEWLTIPVKAKLGMSINEVYPARANWQKEHLKIIRQTYAKTLGGNEGWLEHLYGISSEPVLDIFKHYEGWSLAEINLYMLYYWKRYFEIDTKIVLLSHTPVTSTGTQRLVDLCRYLQADRYLAGSGAEAYIEPELFREIQLVKQNFTHPEYSQTWSRGEFVPGMGCVDFLLRAT